jgi:hypothetical protein
MSKNKYQEILGAFVVIAVLLALIAWAVISLPERREARAVPGWVVGSSAGLNFQYPPAFSTKYISPVDWPPLFQILTEDFECTEAGENIERAGRTEEKLINGKTYCVTEVVQGAAGSIYTQYAYAFEVEDEIVVMTFTTRMPQCVNYPELEMGECESERMAFNIDDLAAQIAETVE